MDNPFFESERYQPCQFFNHLPLKPDVLETASWKRVRDAI